MSFLIPTAHPNPSGIARFGRLLHWIALALAALLLVGAFMALTATPVAPTLAHPYPNQGLSPGAIVFWAALVALIGRGARYLFAGE